MSRSIARRVPAGMSPACIATVVAHLPHPSRRACGDLCDATPTSTWSAFKTWASPALRTTQCSRPQPLRDRLAIDADRSRVRPPVNGLGRDDRLERDPCVRVHGSPWLRLSLHEPAGCTL